MAKKARRRRRRGTRTAAATRRGRRGIATLSLTDLERELARRRKRLQALQARREALVAEIEGIDRELAQAAGPGRRRRTRAGGRRRRARTGRAKKKAAGKARKRTTRRSRGSRGQNKTTLADALHAALQGKTMGVAEVAAAVQEAGYKTASPNFRTIVNTALGDRKRFKKVARGQYTAR